MVLTEVKRITIPEGNVVKITANGQVLWKADDGNLFKLGTSIYDYTKGYNETVPDYMIVNATEKYIQANGNGQFTTTAMRNTIYKNDGGRYGFSAKFEALNEGYEASPRLIIRLFDVDGNIITSGWGNFIYNGFSKAYLYVLGSVEFSCPSNCATFQVGVCFETKEQENGQPVRISNIMLKEVL